MEKEQISVIIIIISSYKKDTIQYRNSCILLISESYLFNTLTDVFEYMQKYFSSHEDKKHFGCNNCVYGGKYIPFFYTVEFRLSLILLKVNHFVSFMHIGFINLHTKKFI